MTFGEAHIPSYMKLVVEGLRVQASTELVGVDSFQFQSHQEPSTCEKEDKVLSKDDSTAINVKGDHLLWKRWITKRLGETCPMEIGKKEGELEQNIQIYISWRKLLGDRDQGLCRFKKRIKHQILSQLLIKRDTIMWRCWI